MLCTAVCPEIAAAKISGMAFAVLAFFVQGESVVISGGMHQFVDCFPLGGVGSGYDVDGATFRTCAGRSSDTVNIVFGTLRQIIVDNMLNMRNVQSSRGNVGCYQNTVFLFPEIRNDFLPQALFQIAVNGAGRQRKFVQFPARRSAPNFVLTKIKIEPLRAASWAVSSSYFCAAFVLTISCLIFGAAVWVEPIAIRTGFFKYF